MINNTKDNEIKLSQDILNEIEKRIEIGTIFTKEELIQSAINIEKDKIYFCEENDIVDDIVDDFFDTECSPDDATWYDSDDGTFHCL
jgi:hypothetical protein